MAAPPLDARRAESACQHVRALNAQFAAWVQLELQNHPDELWQDGVQDYLSHASQITEKFRDVVDWLTANAESRDGSIAHVVENNVVEGDKNEPKFQINNGKSVLPSSTGSTLSGASSWSFNLLPQNQTSNLADLKNEPKFQNNNGKSMLPTSTGSAFSGASTWSFNLMSHNQTPTLAGSQSLVTKPYASENLDENEPEQPSSPSVQKTEEKGVLVVHEAKCKVYVKPDNPAEKAWKDMGMGQLSIKCKEGATKATKESKPTVVVRNDVGRVLLNALLYPGIKMHIQKNSITTIFHTLGTGSTNEAGKDAVAMARTYLLRLKTPEDTDKLAVAIKEYAPAA